MGNGYEISGWEFIGGILLSILMLFFGLELFQSAASQKLWAARYAKWKELYYTDGLITPERVKEDLIFDFDGEKASRRPILIKETIVIGIISVLMIPVSSFAYPIIPAIALVLNWAMWNRLDSGSINRVWIKRDWIEKIADYSDGLEWRFKTHGRYVPNKDTCLCYPDPNQKDGITVSEGMPVIVAFIKPGVILRVFIGDGFRLPEDEKEKETP